MPRTSRLIPTRQFQVKAIPVTAPPARAKSMTRLTGNTGEDRASACGESLAADFTACVDGSAQSPINVANAIPTPLRNVDFNYQPAQLSIVNNGHTIQGSYGKRDQGDGGSMTVDGTEYRLLQFHFHWAQ